MSKVKVLRKGSVGETAGDLEGSSIKESENATVLKY